MHRLTRCESCGWCLSAASAYGQDRSRCPMCRGTMWWAHWEEVDGEPMVVSDEPVPQPKEVEQGGIV